MPYQRPSPRRDHPAHRVIRLPNRPTIVFVTVCTKARQPVLASQTMHALLRDVWSSATAWFVGRYVIMPDHVHLFARRARTFADELDQLLEANVHAPPWHSDLAGRLLGHDAARSVARA
jgi:hypothetical protein